MKQFLFVLVLVISGLAAIAKADSMVGYSYNEQDRALKAEFPTASVAKVVTAAVELRDPLPYEVIVYVNGTTLAIDTRYHPKFNGEEVTALVQVLADKYPKTTTVYVMSDISRGLQDNTITEASAARAYNSYFAVPSVNFGTTTCELTPDGWVSKESHSPLTPSALKAITERGCPKGRINVGISEKETIQHALELYAYHWKKLTGAHPYFVALPWDQVDLGEPDWRIKVGAGTILKDMLYYSTNATATTYWVLHAHHDLKQTITPEVLREWANEHFGAYGSFYDGSGLDPSNVSTPEKMIQFLVDYPEVKDVLPVKREFGNCRAKTGTLPSLGVYNVVGYDGHDRPFVIFVKGGDKELLKAMFRRLNVSC